MEFPLLATPEILTHLEVLGQQVDSRLELGVDSCVTAVLDLFALEEFLDLKPVRGAQPESQTPPQTSHHRLRIARAGRDPALHRPNRADLASRRGRGHETRA
jgi:hypothetical protein